MEFVAADELEMLNDFLAWCMEHKINLSSKIRITNSGTSHRYGIVALEDIRCNESLVEIPRSVAVTPSQSSIASRLESFKERHSDRLQQTSGWISLLLALMYEIKKGNSYWSPYLALCPSINEFNQPMFWNEEEREEELAGLSVLWDVQRDLYNIEREYQQFSVPFIEENLDIMSKDIHDLTLYKHMVGFVMSYSFTDHESNETLMVPVADIFNHHTNNNAQLSFDDESHLRMISTKPIKKGEEIFNTFGKLGNAHLLHMYGFVEKNPNPNDCVEVSLTQIVDSIESSDVSKLPVLQAMLAFMRKMGIADEKDPFVFFASGLKSGPDLYAVLRILHMDFKEFCGLLQDHVSWYQDSYFLYLLEHVNEAACNEQNGECDPSGAKIDDSDDDIIIVREVKGLKKENEIVMNDNNEKEKQEKTDVIGTIKKDGDILEGNAVKGGIVKEQKVKEGFAACTASDIPILETRKETATCDFKLEGHKKESSVSDSSRKQKNRKRKQAVLIEDSDDSDEDLSIRKKQNRNEKTNNIYSTKRRNNNIEKEIKEGREDSSLLLDTKVGAKEETAKWVLQLPNYNDEGHSEDPDDDSDGEDSEANLQLTYEQISSILPASWKVTMRDVIANALAHIKEDPPGATSSNISQHAFLAWQVRSGQRRILHLLKKSLGS